MNSPFCFHVVDCKKCAKLSALWDLEVGVGIWPAALHRKEERKEDRDSSPDCTLTANSTYINNCRLAKVELSK
jgi:hypothetical protein